MSRFIAALLVLSLSPASAADSSLREQLDAAVAAEDYTLAAALKSDLESTAAGDGATSSTTAPATAVPPCGSNPFIDFIPFAGGDVTCKKLQLVAARGACGGTGKGALQLVDNITLSAQTSYQSRNPSTNSHVSTAVLVLDGQQDPIGYGTRLAQPTPGRLADPFPYDLSFQCIKAGCGDDFTPCDCKMIPVFSLGKDPCDAPPCATSAQCNAIKNNTACLAAGPQGCYFAQGYCSFNTSAIVQRTTWIMTCRVPQLGTLGISSSLATCVGEYLEEL